MNGKTEEWFKCGQMVLNKQESALRLLVTRDGNLMQRRQCKDVGPIVASTRNGKKTAQRIHVLAQDPAEWITGGQTDMHVDGVLQDLK